MSEFKLGEYDPEALNVCREAPQYMEGRNAFESCYTEDDCEYEPETDERMAWLCGFYDARTTDRVGHVLKRYKVSYP